ncbi:uroporphyrinogen-III synthase [Thalassovita litoralis]|jgi:uroporphyrinogen-III synthase|uniref:Uroporphyrinogen-III synthase n=1 Tax=Thalassovita litoralis TaxID=1010611 RepID=A0A521FT82_9RHOB|nr:uroporphyrinogen-III synthase [Thalassovita litoralis]SMO98750.1 uroporphyrinogen-III synthase [Thalassovita litoralis]
MRPSILLTRPKDGAERFAAQLRARVGGNLRIVSSPLLDIVPIGTAPDISAYRGLILTSVNAVPFGAPGVKCYTVGDATADAARRAGMEPISAGADAQVLIRRILADAPKGPLLHLRGEHARGQIAQTLTAAGIPTDERVVYAQMGVPLSDAAQTLLNGDLPVIVPLFSPRTAGLFAKQYTGVAPVWAVAISDAAAQELRNSPIARIFVANAPNAQAMLELIEGLIDADTCIEG